MFFQAFGDGRNLATDPVQIELSTDGDGTDTHADLAAPDAADLPSALSSAAEEDLSRVP